ncbi:glycine cleavage system H protein [Sulfitobacter undariae]|jgi:glycine cleavage system H protein|uniref:Glycine cleavage system H protein n=1 Tax=Sulfitobacter undariae TaxID=1563671 RepID=A0A7W6EBM8_9RHOB|nr:glycine cleavage system protein GcvH [Sulfitobacter undariae]MBB3994784.1 glycine cleavage system H protein [Sulfitobacter undariae]
MKFTEEHLWLRIEDGEDAITVGLTPYGVGELGDVTFVELPDEGDMISTDDPVVVIEADDDAVDILAPLDGEVIEVNSPLTRAPEVISEDPLGDGWLFKMNIEDVDALEELMDEATYQKYIR